MPSDYPYIKAWGRLLGTYKQHVDAEIERAQMLDAPHDAMYQRANGSWGTFRSIQNADTKELIQTFVDRMYSD
jgi:hypothetical protein